MSPDNFRVGIDGYNLAFARGTGVATYARNLSQVVHQLGRPIDMIYGIDVPRGARTHVRETLFYERLGEGRAGDEAGGSKLRDILRRAVLSPLPRRPMEIPLSGRVVNDALAHRMPRFDRIFTLGNAFYLSQRYFRRYGRFMPLRLPDPPAVMHWTYPLPLKLEGSLNLYTLHDLVPLKLPFTSLEDKRYYDKLIRTCLKTADHIVTVSEASRRDILDMFPVDPERVTNTYQAVTPSRVAGIDEQTLAGRLRYLFNLEPGEYFLFFGAVEPKKNVGRLIEAFFAAELDTRLVIVGPRAWKADEELRLIEAPRNVRAKAAWRVKRLEYLPSEHLHSLVRGAKAVLFPSLYEGFGLPVLEAMMAGTPTMVGDAASLPEIAGDAALKVNPYDVRAMSEALKRLDSDAGLRRTLSEAGRKRAALFSMDAYAARLNELHMTLLSGQRQTSYGVRSSPLGQPQFASQFS